MSGCSRRVRLNLMPSGAGSTRRCGGATLPSSTSNADSTTWCGASGDGLTSSTPSTSSYRNPSSGSRSRSSTVHSPVRGMAVMRVMVLPRSYSRAIKRYVALLGRRAVETEVGPRRRRAALVLVARAVDRRPVRVLGRQRQGEYADLPDLHAGVQLDRQVRQVGQLESHVAGEPRV